MTESITNEDILKEFLSKIICSDESVIFIIDEYKDNIEDALRYIIECLYNDIKFEYDDSTKFKYIVDTVEKLVEIFKNKKEIIVHNIVQNKLIENSHRLNNHVMLLLQQKLNCGIKLKYDNELLKTPENLVNIFTQKSSISKEVIIIEIIKQNKNILHEIYNNIFGIVELKAQECVNILNINIKEIKNKKYNQTVEGFLLDIKKTLQQWSELVKQQQLEKLCRLILRQQQLKNQMPEGKFKQYNELLIRLKKLNLERQRLEKRWRELSLEQQRLKIQISPEQLQRWNELNLERQRLEKRWRELSLEQQQLQEKLSGLLKQQQQLKELHRVSLEQQQLQRKLSGLLKQQPVLQPLNELILNSQQLSQQLQDQIEVIDSSDTTDNKISHIIRKGYPTGNLMIEFEKYCKEHGINGSMYSIIWKKLIEKVVEEQNEEERKKIALKEKEYLKSELDNITIEFQNSEIMKHKQKEINEILLINYNFIKTDFLIGNAKTLLKLIDNLVTNFNLSNDLKRKNDYKYVINSNKKLFEKIEKQIKNISPYDVNLEDQLNNYVFEIIIDNYMKIHNNKKYKEKLTLDNVYEKGKRIEKFKKIAKIFLGNENNALEKYCKERNEKKLKEDIEKLKKLERYKCDIEEKYFIIRYKEINYTIPRQYGKSLIYCIENEKEGNDKEQFRLLLEDIESILQSQQIQKSI